MNTNAKKLINHKNYTMQYKRITQLESEEIKKELQESQISNLSKRQNNWNNCDFEQWWAEVEFSTNNTRYRKSTTREYQ
jgi:hypothetical protein